MATVRPGSPLAQTRIHRGDGDLTFKRRIISRMPFAGIIKSSPYSTRFQDKG